MLRLKSAVSGASNREALIVFNDKGELRAALGATELETIGTGEVAKRAESSLVLSDKEGKVMWQAPPD